jgi:hypothetical protein
VTEHVLGETIRRDSLRTDATRRRFAVGLGSSQSQFVTFKDSSAFAMQRQGMFSIICIDMSVQQSSQRRVTFSFCRIARAMALKLWCELHAHKSSSFILGCTRTTTEASDKAARMRNEPRTIENFSTAL